MISLAQINQLNFLQINKVCISHQNRQLSVMIHGFVYLHPSATPTPEPPKLNNVTVGFHIIWW